MRKLTDADNWNSALLNLPQPHVLQSWSWGAFKGRHGWQAQRWLWQRDGHDPWAAAQVLTQQRSRLTLGYIPKGPSVAWDNREHVTQLLDDLEALAKRESMILLKIDPDVRADTELGASIKQVLKRRGWRPSFEQIQFRNTMLLDITPELDTILMDMKSKWRYNVRLAARKGVEVRVADRAELPALYKMYAETSARHEFIIRDEAYYLDAWTTFMDDGLAIPLLAEVEDEPVAMLILFHFGTWAWYMYGASLDVYRGHMPNHRLQWEAIRHAKDVGCETYDLWGAPDELKESDPMWGVYRFKVGFGAEFAPHIGAYDYAPRPWLYRLYAFLRPRWVKLAHRLHWAKQS